MSIEKTTKTVKKSADKVLKYKSKTRDELFTIMVANPLKTVTDIAREYNLNRQTVAEHYKALEPEIREYNAEKRRRLQDVQVTTIASGYEVMNELLKSSVDEKTRKELAIFIVESYHKEQLKATPETDLSSLSTAMVILKALQKAASGEDDESK